jgi:hypothetical protein
MKTRTKEIIVYLLLALIVFTIIYFWIGWQNYVEKLPKVNQTICSADILKPIALNNSFP